MTKTDPQWYKKIWTLDIQDMSWVEETSNEVNFIETVLSLQGTERILDLACGFGRHSLEFARRGYSIVGVDITPAYISLAGRWILSVARCLRMAMVLSWTTWRRSCAIYVTTIIRSIMQNTIS